MEYFIYKITNIKTGKFYIGKTKNLKKRWSDHIRKTGKQRHPLYDAMDSHGIESFTIEVIDSTTDIKMIDELEKKWILNTNAIQNGYNLTKGGDGGDTFTNMSKDAKQNKIKKLREHMKKNNPMFNSDIKKKHSEIVNSIEYREKIKIARQKSTTEDLNKRRSEKLKETLKSPILREKWSKCKMGSKNGRWLGYVKIEYSDGGYNVFESAVEAAKILKMSSHRLRDHCKNNTSPKQSVYRNCKFSFISELPT